MPPLSSSPPPSASSSAIEFDWDAAERELSTVSSTPARNFLLSPPSSSSGPTSTPVNASNSASASTPSTAPLSTSSSSSITPTSGRRTPKPNHSHSSSGSDVVSFLRSLMREPPRPSSRRNLSTGGGGNSSLTGTSPSQSFSSSITSSANSSSSTSISVSATSQSTTSSTSAASSSSVTPSALETVDLSHRQLANLDTQAINLLAQGNVERLALGYNSLTSLPVEFVQLGSSLRYLNVRVNNITVFPQVLCELRSLEILDISRNKIRSLPRDPGFLIHLKVFSFTKNEVKQLPPYIANMSHLRVLRLENNPIEWPPPEVTSMPTLPPGHDERTKAAESEAIQRWLATLQRWLHDHAADYPATNTRQITTYDSDYSSESVHDGATARPARNQSRSLENQPSSSSQSSIATSTISNTSSSNSTSTTTTTTTNSTPSSTSSTPSKQQQQQSSTSQQQQKSTPPLPSLPKFPNNVNITPSSQQPRPIPSPSQSYNHDPNNNNNSGNHNNPHGTPTSLDPNSTIRSHHSRNASHSITPRGRPELRQKKSLPDLRQHPDQIFQERMVDPQNQASLPQSHDLSSYSPVTAPQPPVTSPGTPRRQFGPEYFSPSTPSASHTPKAATNLHQSQSARAPAPVLAPPIPLQRSQSDRPGVLPTTVTTTTAAATTMTASTSTPSSKIIENTPKSGTPNLRSVNDSFTSSSSFSSSSSAVTSASAAIAAATASPPPTTNRSVNTALNSAQVPARNDSVSFGALLTSSPSTAVAAAVATSSAIPTTSAGATTTDHQRPVGNLDRNSGAYFRRLSMLPPLTMSKVFSSDLLRSVDAVRGILFSLSQIHSALKQFLVFATQDAVPGALAKVLASADTSMARFIDSLDRFDSATRRNSAQIIIAREVFECCRENIGVFSKLVNVLAIQLKLLVNNADVRYTRTLLLMLYGSMGELARSWEMISVLSASPQSAKSPLENLASQLSPSPSSAQSSSAKLALSPTTNPAPSINDTSSDAPISNHTATTSTNTTTSHTTTTNNNGNNNNSAPTNSNDSSINNNNNNNNGVTPQPRQPNSAAISNGQSNTDRARARRHAGSFSVEDVQLGASMPPANGDEFPPSFPPVPPLSTAVLSSSLNATNSDRPLSPSTSASSSHPAWSSTSSASPITTGSTPMSSHSKSDRSKPPRSGTVLAPTQSATVLRPHSPTDSSASPLPSPNSMLYSDIFSQWADSPAQGSGASQNANTPPAANNNNNESSPNLNSSNNSSMNSSNGNNVSTTSGDESSPLPSNGQQQQHHRPNNLKSPSPPGQQQLSTSSVGGSTATTPTTPRPTAPRSAAAREVDEQFLDMVDATTNIAFSVCSMLSEALSTNLNLDEETMTESDKKVRDLIDLCETGDDVSRRLKQTLTSLSTFTTGPSASEDDDDFEQGSSISHSRWARVSHGLAIGETKHVWDETNAFAKTVISIATMARRVSAERSFPKPVREGLGQLARATKELATLLQVSSFAEPRR